jgi:hypothetical protein
MDPTHQHIVDDQQLTKHRPATNPPQTRNRPATFSPLCHFVPLKSFENATKEREEHKENNEKPDVSDGNTSSFFLLTFTLCPFVAEKN